VTQLRYLLDTDILVAIRRGRPAEVRARFEQLQSGEAALSVISYGELLYGIEKHQMGPEPLRRLEELVNLIPVLPLSPDAARIYGVNRADLARRGEIIGANDLWIAAHAQASDLILVSNNEREFNRIGGLKLENWMR
jgi:tRNA(fMet)-specific endonuclease VapC